MIHKSGVNEIWRPKNLGSKNLGLKKHFESEQFGSEENLAKKKFWIWKRFEYENISGRKNLGTKKFWSKNSGLIKILVEKKFGSQKNFVPQNFGPNFLTLSRHPFQSHSLYLADTNNTPSKKLPDTLRTLSRHPPETLRHLSDTPQTPYRWSAGTKYCNCGTLSFICCCIIYAVAGK